MEQELVNCRPFGSGREELGNMFSASGGDVP